MPGESRRNRGDYARMLFYFACEATGASSARHSLRPLNFRCASSLANSSASRGENAEVWVISAPSLGGANATKQSIFAFSCVDAWIASLALAMTVQTDVPARSLLAYSAIASAVFIPPPVFGEEGGRIVSGANDVTGGGLFRRARPPPTRRFAPPQSELRSSRLHKRGRDKKECSPVKATTSSTIRPLGCLKFKSKISHNRRGRACPGHPRLSYKAAHAETQKSAKAGVALADQFVASCRGAISQASKPPLPWRRSAPTRSSSGSGKQSGRGRLASSGDDLPDTPCSRC